MSSFGLSVLGMRSWVLALAVAGSSAAAASTPLPTPTPAPKLSGGFGRPRSTPPPTPASEAAGQSLLVNAAKTSSAGASEKSTLTIDNRSLVKNPSKGRVSTGRASGTAPQHPAPTAVPTPNAVPAAATPVPAGETSGTPGTEAEWKQIAARARKRVTDDKARVDELAAATKKLENDFYAWDDGQYRDRVIKPAWDRSRADLETAKQELAEAEKDLADLPEKARKAGALPGWIRE